MWTVRAPMGQRVRAVFNRIELTTQDKWCLEDYVEVSTLSGVLAKYCNHTPPFPVVTVAAHVMIVKFMSDEAGTGLGFDVDFSAVMDPVTATSCGSGTELRTDDIIRIPHIADIPSTWTEWIFNCNWTVTAPAGMVVDGRFKNFDIGRPPKGFEECSENYFKISPLSGATRTYCGTYPQDSTTPLTRLISSERTVRLEIRQYGGKGDLSAEFKAVDPGLLLVQYFSNIYPNRAVSDKYIRPEERSYATISVEGSPEESIALQPHAIAQVIHDSQTEKVKITVSIPNFLKSVTFESKPTQNYVIKLSGVYTQDGWTDLTRTARIWPEYSWEV